MSKPLTATSFQLIPSEHLALISRLAQEFNASHDPDELLERVLGEVIEATCAERGLVMLADPALDLAQPEPPPPAHLTAHTTHGMAPGALDAPDFQVSLGIIEQVVRQGEAVLTMNALEDERFKNQQSVIFHQLRSIVCVPMMVQRRVIGAIYVDNRFHVGMFSQQDLELLSAIGATAAIAIENARLFFSVETSLRTLRTLYQVNQDLTATLEVERVLRLAVGAMQELLGAAAATILKVQGKELVFEIAVGEGAELLKPFRLPAEDGVAGWVIRQMQPVFINDVSQDPRFIGAADRITGYTTRSIAVAPLVINERATGILAVVNKPGGFTQADLELLTTFASTAAIALENARLYGEAVEKGRLERELQMARHVQTSMLPQGTPDLPGWEFAAQWLPARQVGGDYYDFVPLQPTPESPGRIGLVIADATDKGAPAALFMANVRSTLRAACYSAASPLEGVQRANYLISADSYSSMFITLFYGELDPHTGELTYINAGHNPPLLCSCSRRPADGRPILLRASGIPLGIDAETSYVQHTLRLDKKDFVIFYTDGVTEALNEAGEDFGMERLQQAIAGTDQSCTAHQILEMLLHSLREFMGSADQYDDITLLVARRI
jgi:sigma-B regulation protein RsbU (phosphoserine phosphatase)